MFGLFSWKKKKQKTPDQQHTPVMLLNSKTPFAVTEAYKKIRTNLQFAVGASDSQMKNVIAISSCLPGEGKSLTSSNLSITTAEISNKVLLIDADMRKPVQHKTFQIPNEKGLSTLLAGTSSLQESVQVNVRPRLDVLTAGPIPPNPSELLASGNMQKLLEKASELYDYVIIDTSPMDVVTDALIVSAKISGLLLIICPEICRQANLRRVMNDIELSETKILGAIVSNVRNDGSVLPVYKKKSYYNYKNHYSSQDQ